MTNLWNTIAPFYLRDNSSNDLNLNGEGKNKQVWILTCGEKSTIQVSHGEADYSPMRVSKVMKLDSSKECLHLISYSQSSSYRTK